MLCSLLGFRIVMDKLQYELHAALETWAGTISIVGVCTTTTLVKAHSQCNDGRDSGRQRFPLHIVRTPFIHALICPSCGCSAGYLKALINGLHNLIRRFGFQLFLVRSVRETIASLLQSQVTDICVLLITTGSIQILQYNLPS